MYFKINRFFIKSKNLFILLLDAEFNIVKKYHSQIKQNLIIEVWSGI